MNVTNVLTLGVFFHRVTFRPIYLVCICMGCIWSDSIRSFLFFTFLMRQITCKCILNEYIYLFTMHMNRMQCTQHSTVQHNNAMHFQFMNLALHPIWMVWCACMLADSVSFCIWVCVRISATCYCCRRSVPVCISKESIWTKGNGNLKRMKVACNYASISCDSFLFLLHLCICVCAISQFDNDHISQMHFIHIPVKRKTECNFVANVCVCMCFHFGEDSAMNFCRM